MAVAVPMPPSDDAARRIFGRFAPPFKIAIVGLPNAGKTTLASAIINCPIVNRFVPLPSTQTYETDIMLWNPKFDLLCQIYHDIHVNVNVAEVIRVIDSPGLIRGAHIGEGYGRAFLDNLRDVDVLYHVLRIHGDDRVAHVDGAVNVERDLECVRLELQLEDVRVVEMRVNKLKELLQGKRRDKTLNVEYDLCIKVLRHLREGNDVRSASWNECEHQILGTYNLLSAKPVVYMVNMNTTDFLMKSNVLLTDIVNWATKHHAEAVICFSGDFEQKVAANVEGMDRLKRIPQMIKTGFRVSHVIHFFTAEIGQVKCWQVRRGTRVDEVARAIERTVSSVEVMKFEDMHIHQSEAAVKAAGKCNSKSMRYLIQDGDIIILRS